MTADIKRMYIKNRFSDILKLFNYNISTQEGFTVEGTLFQAVLFRELVPETHIAVIVDWRRITTLRVDPGDPKIIHSCCCSCDYCDGVLCARSEKVTNKYNSTINKASLIIIPKKHKYLSGNLKGTFPYIFRDRGYHIVNHTKNNFIIKYGNSQVFRCASGRLTTKKKTKEFIFNGLNVDTYDNYEQPEDPVNWFDAIYIMIKLEDQVNLPTSVIGIISLYL
jgi:hypothetical protein